MVQFWSSFNAFSKTFSFVSSFVKMFLLKSSKSTIDPSQFLRFLEEVLVKSGRLHFNIFEQQDVGEILACILDELCGDFILALDLVQVKTKVTIDCLSCHQSIDNEDPFSILKLPLANTMQSSLDSFLMPEHLSGDNSFFCCNCSSLKPAFFEHGFLVIQFLIIQLKRFVNFQRTVTKDTILFGVSPIPVILDNDVVVVRMFTLISTANNSGNLNNGHYAAHVRNNFCPAWYHCNNAAVISRYKEVLENNTSYVLFYKTV